MRIQEALQIVADLARIEHKKVDFLKGSMVVHAEALALAIVEIMIVESAFFTSYQEQSVEAELEIQAEESLVEMMARSYRAGEEA